MEIDLYDLFNIEHQNTILNIYYDIIDYTDNNGLYLNKKKYPEFFNIIFNNINYENSSEFLKSYYKSENEELLLDSSEKDIDDFDDNHY